MKFTTGTRATDPGRTYDREPVPVGDTIRVIAGELGITLPADPDLYARTAPAFNCITDPVNGPHYINSTGGCSWCSMTNEQITDQRHAQTIAMPVPKGHWHAGTWHYNDLHCNRPGPCWLHPGGCPATCPRYTAPAVQGELSRDSYPPARRRA